MRGVSVRPPSRVQRERGRRRGRRRRTGGTKAVTGFSIGDDQGINNNSAHTVVVLLPESTDRTSLVPNITHKGKTIKPASDKAQDLSGAVTYRVTAANGSTVDWIVYALPRPLKTTENVSTYLSGMPGGAGAAAPVPLSLGFALTDTNWYLRLYAMGTAGKFVTLDLSACTMTGTATFNPYTSDTETNHIVAKSKIVSLVLPAVATGIIEGTDDTPTFKNLTVLKSVSGAGVITVGDYAFKNCAVLDTVDFPKAESVGNVAFSLFTALANVKLPAVTNLGDSIFSNTGGGLSRSRSLRPNRIWLNMLPTQPAPFPRTSRSGLRHPRQATTTPGRPNSKKTSARATAVTPLRSA